MAESDLPIFDITVAQLFRASHLSLDPSTTDFALRRVIPISIYIDGDFPGVAEDLSDEIRRIMTEAGYPPVGAWGPFYGSYFITLFGRGEKPESGLSVQKHLKDLGSRFLGLKERIPAGVWAVMVIGTAVIEIAGAAAVASVVSAALPVSVPVVVFEYVAHTVAATEAIEAVCHALNIEKKPPFPKEGRSFDL
jgi:hypothetical protein